jgi:hypothetical protein
MNTADGKNARLGQTVWNIFGDKGKVVKGNFRDTLMVCEEPSSGYLSELQFWYSTPRAACRAALRRARAEVACLEAEAKAYE